MESVLSHVGTVFYQKPRLGTKFNTCSFGGVDSRRARSVVVVKAETGGVNSINPDIRKNEDKVVDSVVLSELAKPLTPYCR
ncbi:cdgsh iron-sulfur domain-containing protein 2-like [Trifolium pratense]|uniref:Cdgsh iron-sulfur domain-containing protein 2-like n=1 Tax=Trifolium pratense TaxID=57577 RepID=A0A2K3KYM7_TRIPR|nr:cdgsh iron-sulfur domain-containing protein 2-like [Trifolium pratense]